jgi:Flp pilus assembly pilin Flp
MGESGAVMVEYALIAVLVVLVAAVAAEAIGPGLNTIFDSIAGWF